MGRAVSKMIVGIQHIHVGMIHILQKYGKWHFSHLGPIRNFTHMSTDQSWRYTFAYGSSYVVTSTIYCR
jgi:hypothetical protein